MTPKTYSVETVETVAAKIASAPILEPKSLTQDQVLKRLSKEIKTLHTRKNYSAKEITAFLMESGIKTTLKEVKNILGIARKTGQKSQDGRAAEI